MSNTNLAKDLKNVSEKDRKQIEQAQEMLGPDPSTMGVIKNVFWGNFREDLVFPYPTVSAEETATVFARNWLYIVWASFSASSPTPPITFGVLEV